MTIYLRNAMSSFVALLALALAATPVLASGLSLHGDATPISRKAMLWGLPRDDPAIAIGAIVAALLLIAAVAWIAARVGDKC